MGTLLQHDGALRPMYAGGAGQRHRACCRSLAGWPANPARLPIHIECCTHPCKVDIQALQPGAQVELRDDARQAQRAQRDDVRRVQHVQRRAVRV